MVPFWTPAELPLSEIPRIPSRRFLRAVHPEEQEDRSRERLVVTIL